jgi:hypothetical protein
VIGRFLWVIDDFYPDPDAVRRKALELPYEEPEEVTGRRTQPYHPPGVRQHIEGLFGLRITEWNEDPRDLAGANGSFFVSLAWGGHAERVGVHYDSPVDWVTMVVYLTPKADPAAGTSLWQHKATGLTSSPMSRDVRRLGVSRARLEAILERDSCDLRRWREIDRVGNRYNRAVAYPAGLLHSASRHFGGAFATGRIYQSFHFGADLGAMSPRRLECL